MEESVQAGSMPGLTILDACAVLAFKVFLQQVSGHGPSQLFGVRPMAGHLPLH